MRFALRSLFAIILAAGLVGALSCSEGPGGVFNGGGGVQLVLSSSSASAAPAGGGDGGPNHDDDREQLERITAAEVTLSSILARDLEGRLIDVTIDLPVTFDLLSLGNGREVMLPVGFLPPGIYDQIVLVITQVRLELRDGTQIEITPPGGGWTAVIPTATFTVVEGETATIHIRFHPEHSFSFFNGRFDFDPDFEHDDRHDD